MEKSFSTKYIQDGRQKKRVLKLKICSAVAHGPKKRVLGFAKPKIRKGGHDFLLI